MIVRALVSAIMIYQMVRTQVSIVLLYLLCHDVFSVSKYQPFLTTFVKGRNDYINAVRVPVSKYQVQKGINKDRIEWWYFREHLNYECLRSQKCCFTLQSFTNSTGFIMTQMPLSGTEVDLWRLCMDHDAEAMVILNDNSEVLYSPNSKKKYIYLSNLFFLHASRNRILMYSMFPLLFDEHLIHTSYCGVIDVRSLQWKINQ